MQQSVTNHMQRDDSVICHVACYLQISDYGVVGSVGNRELGVGTIPFAAPEVFKKGLKWLDEKTYVPQTAEPVSTI
jgi:hypothetical protein